ncbi:MAG: hypothetical protein HZB91_09860 [Elusimicrobia bacterium]|nr:hypothetical protein [Elusimicrobiota bacterium]
MRKIGSALVLGTALLCLDVGARASYQVTQVDESDLTGPCFINGVSCPSVKTGAVLQVYGGEDLHVHKNETGFQADSYRASEPFLSEALLGTKSFKTIEELNSHLVSRGLRKTTAVELVSVNAVDRKRIGVVLPRLDGVDLYLSKDGGSFIVVQYAFTRVFIKDAKQETFTFKSLEEVNDFLARTARRVRSTSAL